MHRGPGGRGDVQDVRVPLPAHGDEPQGQKGATHQRRELRGGADGGAAVEAACGGAGEPALAADKRRGVERELQRGGRRRHGDGDGGGRRFESIAVTAEQEALGPVDGARGRGAVEEGRLVHTSGGGRGKADHDGAVAVALFGLTKFVQHHSFRMSFAAFFTRSLISSSVRSTRYFFLANPPRAHLGLWSMCTDFIVDWMMEFLPISESVKKRSLSVSSVFSSVFFSFITT